VTREASADFEAAPQSAGRARSFVSTTLDEWGLDHLAERVVLLVSELVSNAVLHAASPVRVRVRLAGERLRVEVVDDSPVPPRLRHFGLDAATGRGLQLVDRVAEEWGVDPREGGKQVWFALPSQGDAAVDAWAQFDVESVEAL
jgi:anti-sigma regulatory factor (Ser/Thr protein kinase)